MISCICVDFDNTLGHFTHGSRDFFNIFLQRKIPRETLEKVYKETACALGFSFPHFVNFLADAVGGIPNRENLGIEFEEWLQRELTVYPDSIPACTLWQRHHIPVCIITAGEEQYQKHKVALLHIPHDDVIVVQHVNEKAPATKKLLKRYGRRIVFIDDKESELDQLCDAGIGTDDVLKVHINRPDSPYGDQKSRYEHLEIESLLDPNLATALE